MYLFIKYKFSFLACIGLACIALLINSCKKDNSDTVHYFLVGEKWQLASVQRQTFVGDTLKKTDTLNTACDSIQKFQFNSDNTCTYENYHCIPQINTGTWQLVSDDLVLQTNLTVKDTLNGAIVTNAKAFAYAQIINLGQYSFVVQTGDVSSYYTSKTRRVITRYGFIHPTNN
ncbi:DUF5004 domain-containing protein [Mucilaginibacter paludis]|uniref:Lipocalin-like domain-containing protein n=1 Tax=Mucilaginibacter paludis DSM 18603 TaxID=714943 RepID=H1Y0D0_9SPHI|nr:DUF5004 domain-containing protein [Mucilaginibacter paludis]EHQ28179.1 hypothetical protein Mucpa_4088 [Mucilaginibacter paludis DSM 18603]